MPTSQQQVVEDTNELHRPHPAEFLVAPTFHQQEQALDQQQHELEEHLPNPEQNPTPQAARAHERVQTRPIPLYQRLVHALCLTLIPYMISRVVSWLLVKYSLFPEYLAAPVLSYIRPGLQAVASSQTGSSSAALSALTNLASPKAAMAASSTSFFSPTESLIDKFVLVFVTELGYEQDWWLTKAAGASVFIVYTFVATLAISFSAVFHSLCFFFIMGKKWNTISNYMAQFRNGELANLGVF